jgi:hypothetical protein
MCAHAQENVQPAQESSPVPDPSAVVGPAFRDQTVPAVATLIFKFENPQLQPAKFQITLHPDGTGHFVSLVGNAPPPDIADLPPEGQEQDITVSEAVRKQMFLVAVKEHGFAMKCDTGGSKVAFQGTKTLVYEGPDLKGACTYNYSSDQKIQWLTNQLLGMATTLEEGRRLTVEHTHGRLTLDAELETLATMVKEGQATEVENIAPILQTIVADENVMTRARRRAQVLLDSDGSVAVH